MKDEDYRRLKSGADIRGRAIEAEGQPAPLTPQGAERIGYAFALMLAARQKTTPDKLLIAVGHDARQSGPALYQAFIHGLTDADCDVLDCGLCTTPVMFWAAKQGGADGAAMVTASHHPWYENGFKLVGRDGALSGEEIEALLAAAQDTQPPMRLVKPWDMKEKYLADLRQMVARRMDTQVQCPLLGLHVVVDAMGGAGGFYARFLEELGCEVTGSRGLEPQGRNPQAGQPFDGPQALATISQAVTVNTADMGVLLDADGDRAVIVDGQGRVINGNRLIALISAILLEERPGATIVTDSATSSGLKRFITEWGGVHYRFKRGYQNVIQEAIRLNGEGIDCPLAIETSGHAAFRENGFLDDGLYLATRLACEALLRKREGEPLGSLIQELSEPVERAEIRLGVLTEDMRQAAQSVTETILSHTLEDGAWHLAGDSREGVRILFDLEGGVENAWFQLRPSVHEPQLVLSAESDVPGGVRDILGRLYQLIQQERSIDLDPLRSAVR